MLSPYSNIIIIHYVLEHLRSELFLKSNLGYKLVLLGLLVVVLLLGDGRMGVNNSNYVLVYFVGLCSHII